MQKTTFIALVNKYLSDEASPAEQQLVETYLDRLEADDRANLSENFSGKETRIWEKLALHVNNNGIRLQQQIDDPGAPVVHRVHFLRTSWFRYAAAVVLLVGGAVVLRLAQDNKNEGTLRQAQSDNNYHLPTILKFNNRGVRRCGIVKVVFEKSLINR